MFLAANPAALLLEHADGYAVVLCDGERSCRHKLNRTGYEILGMCDGSMTDNDIVASLENRYRMDDRDKKSVISFLKKHVSLGYLHEQSSSDCGRAFRSACCPDLILPQFVGIGVTHQCQMRCRHCYNDSGEIGGDELSSLEIADLVDEFADVGVTSFFLTGGEPFMKKDVGLVIERLARRRMATTIATNGLFVPDEILEKLIDHESVSLQVSIDGLSATHDFIRGIKGAYEATKSNIERLVSAGIKVTIAYTLNDLNIGDLEQTVVEFADSGCAAISIGMMINSGRALSGGFPHGTNKIFLETLAKIRARYDSPGFRVGSEVCEELFQKESGLIPYANKCGAGYRSIGIKPNGAIVPCVSVFGKVMGHVRELDRALHANNVAPWRDVPSPTRELCGSCPEYENCGNCIARMLDAPGFDCVIRRDGW
ncbi:MAG: PqqD family peptide modification chaperone [Slackia sp.]|nr:PqqD family peptide modification chaperone [Slackia sp.]